MKNFSQLQNLLKDEKFRSFLEHPAVKEMMHDDEFQKAAKEKNYFSLMSNPRMIELMKDPEIREKLSQLNLKNFNINK